MPQTGGLGAGGQAALIGIRMWVDDVNAKGGLLGRKVEFIVYDDQSNGANTPGIYTKLLDVDKVDILIAPYATNPTAPIMPLVKERGKLLMGNFSFQVNSKVQHDMWFNNAPWNDARGWSEGFLEAGKNAGAKVWPCLQPMLSSNRIWPMARAKLPKVQAGTLFTTKTTQATTQTSPPSFAQFGQPGQRQCLWLATRTKRWPSCAQSMRLA